MPITDKAIDYIYGSLTDILNNVKPKLGIYPKLVAELDEIAKLDFKFIE